MSQIAWQGLLTATDNLGLMVDSQHAIGHRPIAPFTLARASLFAASRTVWILAPSSRRTRQERALWANFEDVRNLVLLVTESPRDPSEPGAVAAKAHVESELNELKEVALDRLGLVLNSKGKPTDTSIIEAAAAYLDPDDGDERRAIKMLWRIHSGHAHGLSWPNLLRPPAEGFVGPDGHNYRRQIADRRAFGEAASAAMLMTNAAFNLYDQRVTAHL
ncbi:hypothetical protein ACFRAQ_09115 [Nocardia sp. NPDC056611]|uniref:hypothetical protein n=1 Tax=Nocardia sp. NPDC056611 TaxID=3345877 RepID=UPI00366C95C4